MADGQPLANLRIVLISTAGLHRKDEMPFVAGLGECRIIPGDAEMDGLIMSYISGNFDRTGFYRDRHPKVAA